MNHHQTRIIISGVVAVLLFTALLLLIPVTSLVIAGYCFCLLAVVEFFGSLGMVAGSTKKSWITNAAFPLAASGYAIVAVLFSGLAVVLEHFHIYTMPVGWFIFIQIVFAAILIWVLLAMQSGKEIIENTGKKAEANAFVWKSLLADVSAILERTDAASQKDVAAVRDVIRYTDPMSAPELEPLDNAIRENVIRLGLLVDQKKADEIASLCITIQRQVKDRGVKAQMLK